MIEQFRDQINYSEKEIKASGLKDLTLEAIEKAGGGRVFTAWVSWSNYF